MNMKRLVIIMLAATVTSSAAFAQYEGSWSTGSSLNLARCSNDDDGKIRMRVNSETGWEHLCVFKRKQQIGPNAWRVTASCEGEGSKWTKAYSFALHGGNLVNGGQTYQRCNKF